MRENIWDEKQPRKNGAVGEGAKAHRLTVRVGGYENHEMHVFFVTRTRRVYISAKSATTADRTMQVLRVLPLRHLYPSELSSLMGGARTSPIRACASPGTAGSCTT